MKQIGISQSNYAPWLGYFELIAQCDTFILLDNVQFTKNDWRNRNKIQSTSKSSTVKWFTVPVTIPFGLRTSIDQVVVPDGNWTTKHRNMIHHAYSSFIDYKKLEYFLDELYFSVKEITSLSEINSIFIKEICQLLLIKTQILQAPHVISDNRNGRLIELCKLFSSSTYVSSTGAQHYLEIANFQQNGIKVEFCDFRKSKHFYITHYRNDEYLSVFDSIFRFGLDRVRTVLNE
jgi:hypothetical protein